MGSGQEYIIINIFQIYFQFPTILHMVFTKSIIISSTSSILSSEFITTALSCDISLEPV